MYFDLRDFLDICMGRKLVSSWHHELQASGINESKSKVGAMDACINKFETGLGTIDVCINKFETRF